MKFLSLFKSHRHSLLIAFFCIVATNILSLAFPWAIKLIVDDILPGKKGSSLALILVLLAGIALVRAVASFWGTYLGMKTGERIATELRERLHDCLLRLSVLTVENAPTGTLLSKVVGDIDTIKRFLFSDVLDFLCSFLTACLVFAVLFWMNGWLALISASCLPFFVLSYLKLSRSLKEKYKKLKNEQGELAGQLGERYRGIRVVQAFGRHAHEMERFRALQNRILRSALGVHRVDTWFWVAAECLSALGLVVLLWFGTGEVMRGQITVGTLMAFYTYIGMLFLPLIKMSRVNGSYQEARASWERVRKIFDEPEGPASPVNPVILRPMRGEVEFQGVSFHYEASRTALSDISLKIRAGETIAIVGPSGSGKTTLAALLARFFDPVSGRILIDGHDLRQLDLGYYRSRLAIVWQNDFLFSQSVFENILYGNPGAGREAVIRAAQAANAHDFIMALPHQYETSVGEGGINLSSGQRQRLAIARAILRDPALLILDEATASVDTVSEHAIASAVQELMRGRTTLMIAHRLSTVRRADRIVVLEDGRIAAVGDHESLIAGHALYRRLYETKFQEVLSL